VGAQATGGRAERYLTCIRDRSPPDPSLRAGLACQSRPGYGIHDVPPLPGLPLEYGRRRGRDRTDRWTHRGGIDSRPAFGWSSHGRAGAATCDPARKSLERWSPGALPDRQPLGSLAVRRSYHPRVRRGAALHGSIHLRRRPGSGLATHRRDRSVRDLRDVADCHRRGARRRRAGTVGLPRLLRRSARFRDPGAAPVAPPSRIAPNRRAR